MAELDYKDIQGIIFRGYGKLPAAYFVLLKMEEGRTQDAKNWLKSLADDITNAVSLKKNAEGVKPLRSKAVHVAFTRQGLAMLGIDGDETSFSCEFEDGMTPDFKRWSLGDHDDDDDSHSAPIHWDWGGTHDDAELIHVLLMLYAPADNDGGTVQLDRLYDAHKQRFETGGLTVVKRLSTRTLIERKEHFGFVDGIAQPIMAGTDRAKEALKENENNANVIATGEFILGYPNEYDKYPESPTILALRDPNNLLPTLKEGGAHDLGHNGSYMVFRQLSQDVKAFWNFLDEKTKKNGQSDPVARDLIAAKMVGRWRSGVPLMLSPDKDDPNMDSKDYDTFGYIQPQDGPGGNDPLGLKCPLGSHIRRTNPRDSVFPGTKDALTMSKVHRILRRGRSYGPPVAPSMEPDDILAAEDPHEKRGLHFICFNTDIGRQFEFVQQTWLCNPKFASMYRELDPLVGDHGKRHRGSKGIFTIPADPLRKRITGVTRYVNVRGGAYFFLPGIKALRVLAELP